jgi:hypothetical protein
LVVGAAQVRLVIRGAHSLKEKRHAIKSIKDRIASGFNVAVAEVDHLDLHQSAVLGIAAVGNDSKYVRGLLQRVVDKIRLNPHAELADSRIEIL